MKGIAAPNPLRRLGLTVVAAIVAAAAMSVLAAGCGSSSGGQAGSASSNAANSQMLAYSKCMRSHGEPKFPDAGSQLQVKQELAASGIDVSSSAYQAADAVCRSKLPHGGGGGMSPAKAQQMKTEALKFSRCIQAHGFPNYPDPGSDGREPDPSSHGIDESSPQWQAAHKVCFRP